MILMSEVEDINPQEHPIGHKATHGHREGGPKHQPGGAARLVNVSEDFHCHSCLLCRMTCPEDSWHLYTMYNN